MQTFLLKIFDADNCNLVVKKFKDWREAGRHIQKLYDTGWTVEAYCRQDAPEQPSAGSSKRKRFGTALCGKFKRLK